MSLSFAYMFDALFIDIDFLFAVLPVVLVSISMLSMLMLSVLSILPRVPEYDNND